MFRRGRSIGVGCSLAFRSCPLLPSTGARGIVAPPVLPLLFRSSSSGCLALAALARSVLEVFPPTPEASSGGLGTFTTLEVSSGVLGTFPPPTPEGSSGVLAGDTRFSLWVGAVDQS